MSKAAIRGRCITPRIPLTLHPGYIPYPAYGLRGYFIIRGGAKHHES